MLPDLLAASCEALLRHKMRTALSVLGVVLGVAAVVAMQAVGEGARADALQQLELLGLDNVIVRQRARSSAESARRPLPGLTVSDAVRLRALPVSDAVSALVERHAFAGAIVGSAQQLVVAVDSDYVRISTPLVERGRFLASADDRQASRVCVLGASVARRMFGGRNPLGDAILVDGTPFRVVGVLAPRGREVKAVGSLLPRDQDENIFVPLATLTGQLTDRWLRVDEVWVKVGDSRRLHEAAAVIDAALLVARGGSRDFDLVIPRELLSERERTQRAFDIVVGSIALIALVVGGIGIMNIMLAAVLERIPEIGLRRAVGATRSHIATQFLAESVAMTGAGGVAGIVVGSGIARAIAAYAGWPVVVSTSVIGIAFAVATVVGVLAGGYPALRASRLEPIDAVRYE